MAKLIFQPIELEHGIETIPRNLEAGARSSLPARIMRVVQTLAVYLPSRPRRVTVETYIPREKYERESRLEFEKFIHW